MSEDGEFSDATKHSEQDSDESVSRSEKVLHKAKRNKKKSRYSELEMRFSKLESLVTKAFEKIVPEANSAGSSGVDKSETNSRQTTTVRHDRTDTVSLFADTDNFDSSDNNEADKENSLSDKTQKCLFEMFGEDAMKRTDKEGIVLDKSQIEVIESSLRCNEPNFLTAFSEENVDLFPLDEEFEKFLKVPSLDSIFDCCLVKRYGNKASFARSKGKVLYTKPCKMVDKICFKGQHAARLGLIMQCYV